MPSEEFSYTAFSQQPFVRELNAHLIDKTKVVSGQRIVDLACGTGSVTNLILDRIRDARESVIIGIDQSAVSLKQAMDDLKDAKKSAVQFIQSRVEPLSETLKESVDTIFFCNAIHYVEDKDLMMEELHKVINPGGKFAFNTSFYEGGQPPQTRPFYRKWMLRAYRILKREYGLTSQGKESKVEARNHLTQEEYRGLLESHRFKVILEDVTQVNVPLEGWLDISNFEDWIRGIMPGVPLDKASAALKKGCEETFRDMNIQYVARNWLDVVAVRK